MTEISQKELRELQKEKGVRVRRQKKPQPKPQASKPDPLIVAARSISVAAKEVSDTSKLVAKLQEELLKRDGKPRPYKFTVHRDKKGLLTTVDAEPAD